MQLWLDCAKAGDYFSDAANKVEMTKKPIGKSPNFEVGLKVGQNVCHHKGPS